VELAGDRVEELVGRLVVDVLEHRRQRVEADRDGGVPLREDLADLDAQPGQVARRRDAVRYHVVPVHAAAGVADRDDAEGGRVGTGRVTLVDAGRRLASEGDEQDVRLVEVVGQQAGADLAAAPHGRRREQDGGRAGQPVGQVSHGRGGLLGTVGIGG